MLGVLRVLSANSPASRIFSRKARKDRKEFQHFSICHSINPDVVPSGLPTAGDLQRSRLAVQFFLCVLGVLSAKSPSSFTLPASRIFSPKARKERKESSNG
jgi:hypothetical protein